jgi:plasmid stabilization system protein ParE
MDVLSGVVIAVVTFTVILAGATVAGFVVLFRRRGDRGLSAGAGSAGSLGRRAGSLLVSLDTALREADEELGFALAQFGPERARDYRDALADARARLTEAFRLKQALDDHIPESDRQRREWTLQIIALCEQAQASLDQQEARFGQLRALEANAAGTLAALRERIATSNTRLDAARATLAEFGSGYAPEAFARVSGNPDEAERLLAQARAACDSAEPGIAASGVNDVSGSLTEAAIAIRSAEQALEAVERTARDLAAASTALDTLRETTRADLVEARAQRDSAPDAETGAAIIAAMAQVESALASGGGPGHPVAELDRIGTAVAQLDLALASARNQASRLAHARAAYEGTLVSATSQIAVARELIARRGGNVTARTRLAEAERQLMIAQAETDPVEALDAIRRAVTHARDADALARY